MNIKDVEKLAALARINLGEEEKQSLLADMQGILEYVKQVENMKIEDTAPEFKVYNVWREDEYRSSEFSPELITSQFPAAHEGFLKVKKIL